MAFPSYFAFPFYLLLSLILARWNMQKPQYHWHVIPLFIAIHVSVCISCRCVCLKLLLFLSPSPSCTHTHTHLHVPSSTVHLGVIIFPHTQGGSGTWLFFLLSTWQKICISVSWKPDLISQWYVIRARSEAIYDEQKKWGCRFGGRLFDTEGAYSRYYGMTFLLLSPEDKRERERKEATGEKKARQTCGETMFDTRYSNFSTF